MGEVDILHGPLWLDTEELFSAIERKAFSERLSLRGVARQLGLSPSTFTRIAQGKRPDVDTYITLCHWMGHGCFCAIDVDPTAAVLDAGKGEGEG